MKKFIGVDYGVNDYTCKVYGHINNKGKIIIDKVRYFNRKEVRKVAIDYKEQWTSLCARHGDKVIVTTAAGHRATLKDVMDSQIRVTVYRREKLMEEFMKERITTNIDGGTKSSHSVNIIYKGRLFGGVTIGKEEFQKWVDGKHEQGMCSRDPVTFVRRDM